MTTKIGFSLRFRFAVFALHLSSLVYASTKESDAPKLTDLTDSILKLYVPQYYHSIIRDTSKSLRSIIIGANGSCDIAFCASMEATTTIRGSRLKMQKATVALLAITIAADSRSSFSAVQYGSTTLSVSPSTSDIKKFVKAVMMLKSKKDKLSNLGAGLGYCGTEVNQYQRKQQVIVILGSGRSTVGFDSKIVAEALSIPNGNLSIVGVPIGGTYENFNNIVQGDKNKFASLWNFNRIAFVLEKLIISICNLKNSSSESN